MNRFEIEIKHSKLYLKIKILVYLLSILTVLNTELPLVLISTMLLGLIVLFLSNTQTVSYQTLIFQNGKWLMIDKHHRQLRVNTISIVFDLKFLLIAHLQSDQRTEQVIWFRDQIESVDLKRLQLTCRLNETKTNSKSSSFFI